MAGRRSIYPADMTKYGFNLGLFSTGATTLALGLTGWQIPTPSGLAAYADHFWYGSLFACVLGSVLIAVSFAQWAVRTARRAGAFAWREAILALERDFADDLATATELPTLCNLGTRAIGASHPSLKTLQERWERNPRIARVLYRVGMRSRSISGYILLYPISRQAEKRIQRGILASARDLQTADILAGFKRCRVVYISMLFGTGMAARGAALLLLKRELKTLNDVDHLYARPASPDGLRLLKRYGFRPVVPAAENGIWELRPTSELWDLLRS